MFKSAQRLSVTEDFKAFMKLNYGNQLKFDYQKDNVVDHIKQPEM